jgi:hypothetical protein
MMIGLLGIAFAYALAVAAVHAAYELHRTRRGAGAETVVLCVTRNSEHVVEWYLRVILFRSRLLGRPVDVVLYDEASSDRTMDIVEKLSQTLGGVTVLQSQEQYERLLERVGLESVQKEVSSLSSQGGDELEGGGGQAPGVSGETGLLTGARPGQETNLRGGSLVVLRLDERRDHRHVPVFM